MIIQTLKRMKKILVFIICLFLLSCKSSQAGELYIQFDPPVNECGTSNPYPIEEIGGYNLHYGTSSGNYSTTINIGLNTSYKLTDLTAGTNYCIVVSSYNKFGQTCSINMYSNEVCKEARLSPPDNKSIFLKIQ